MGASVIENVPPRLGSPLATARRRFKRFNHHSRRNFSETDLSVEFDPGALFAVPPGLLAGRFNRIKRANPQQVGDLPLAFDNVNLVINDTRRISGAIYPQGITYPREFINIAVRPVRGAGISGRQRTVVGRGVKG